MWEAGKVGGVGGMQARSGQDMGEVGEVGGLCGLCGDAEWVGGPWVGMLAVTRRLWGCTTSGGTAAGGCASVFGWPPLSGQSITPGHPFGVGPGCPDSDTRY